MLARGTFLIAEPLYIIITFLEMYDNEFNNRLKVNVFQWAMDGIAQMQANKIHYAFECALI